MATQTSGAVRLFKRCLKLLWRVSKRADSTISSSSRYVPDIEPLPTKYGGKTNITVLPGVGIGPEIMDSTLQVLKAADAPLTFEILPLRSNQDSEASKELENALISIRRNKVAIKGNIEVKSKDPSVASRNILLRKTLDLFAYVLFCRTYPGLANKFGEIDVVVIRQNTEGEYLMLEHEPAEGTVESLKIVTRFASERLAKFAFNYAQEHERKLITVAHNASVHRVTEGLFVEAVLKVSKEHPQVSVNVLEVQVLAAGLVMNPSQFDIILTTNLNGSMISNVLTGMLGGPGLSAGINLGDNGIAVFEPGARNKGSSIVGTGSANPVAMIMAATNLLNYLGYNKTAQILQNSVQKALSFDKVRTKDLGGTATTQQITATIIKHINKQLGHKVETKRVPTPDSWRTYCDLPPDFKPGK